MIKYYDPKTDKYPYPIYTDRHYLVVKKNDGTVFDKDYPYVDKSKSFLRKRKIIRLLIVLIVFPICKIRFGLRIKGKEHIKNNKDILSKGAISCCNHIHKWDYLCIMKALKPIKPYVLVWNRNVSGEDGKNVRMVGGIPIPENDSLATFAYYDAIKGLLNDGEWLHIYPEGSMWEFYRPIRPLKRGASFFAVSFDKPIVPMAFSYRKPSWIRRKIFKQIALFTLNIGEPLYPNKNLDKKEQEEELIVRVHQSMCLLSGVEPEENIYPPIFNNTKRVDYY